MLLCDCPQDDATRQRAVDAAAAEIEAMLMGQKPRRGPAPASFQAVPPPAQFGAPPAAPGILAHIPSAYALGGGQAGGGGALSAQLPVGFEAPPEFGLPGRVRGPSAACITIGLRTMLPTFSR